MLANVMRVALQAAAAGCGCSSTTHLVLASHILHADDMCNASCAVTEPHQAIWDVLSCYHGRDMSFDEGLLTQ